eukprot:1156318-Pelagomonas_calceolata.AAC.10
MCRQVTWIACFYPQQAGTPAKPFAGYRRGVLASRSRQQQDQQQSYAIYPQAERPAKTFAGDRRGALASRSGQHRDQQQPNAIDPGPYLKLLQDVGVAQDVGIAQGVGIAP